MTHFRLNAKIIRFIKSTSLLTSKLYPYIFTAINNVRKNIIYIENEIN